MGIAKTLSSITVDIDLTLYQVFILEGLPAIFCGIYTFFYLPDCELQLSQHELHSLLRLPVA